jgi:hypothetical protein
MITRKSGLPVIRKMTVRIVDMYVKQGASLCGLKRSIESFQKALVCRVCTQAKMPARCLHTGAATSLIGSTLERMDRTLAVNTRDRETTTAFEVDTNRECSRLRVEIGAGQRP